MNDPMTLADHIRSTSDIKYENGRYPIFKQFILGVEGEYHTPRGSFSIARYANRLPDPTRVSSMVEPDPRDPFWVNMLDPSGEQIVFPFAVNPAVFHDVLVHGYTRNRDSGLWYHLDVLADRRDSSAVGRVRSQKRVHEVGQPLRYQHAELVEPK